MKVYQILKTMKTSMEVNKVIANPITRNCFNQSPLKSAPDWKVFHGKDCLIVRDAGGFPEFLITDATALQVAGMLSRLTDLPLDRVEVHRKAQGI